jgi:hypothetical protein
MMDVPAKFKFTKLNILETPNYVVHVGTVPKDKIPQYLVFHRAYGVLEFAHNMIYFVRQALDEMEEKLEQQATEARVSDLPATTPEVEETTPVAAPRARSTKKVKTH